MPKHVWIRSVAIIAVAGMLFGCARNYEPIVDHAGISDEAKYQSDLEDCRQYAEQVDPAGEAVAGLLVGAVLGVALGAATGAILGDAGTGAALGASIGGISGGSSGAGNGLRGQVAVVDRCLLGRGYRVLR